MSFRFRKELAAWVLEPSSDAVTVSEKPSSYAGYTIVRQDYLDSVLRQIDGLREEVKRLRSPIKDYKIDAVAWNAERTVKCASQTLD
jgi:hypothetical protein